MKAIKSFLKDEAGQTSTEYILLVAVVALIIFKLKDKMGGGLEKIVDRVFEKMGGIVEEMDRV